MKTDWKAYKLWRTCGRKKSSFDHEGQARREAHSKNLNTYLCPHCQKWHLTSQGRTTPLNKFVIADANHPHKFRTPEGNSRRYTGQLEKARTFETRKEAEQGLEFGEKVFSLDYLYLQTQKGEHDV